MCIYFTGCNTLKYGRQCGHRKSIYQQMLHIKSVWFWPWRWRHQFLRRVGIYLNTTGCGSSEDGNMYISSVLIFLILSIVLMRISQSLWEIPWGVNDIQSYRGGEKRDNLNQSMKLQPHGSNFLNRFLISELILSISLCEKLVICSN